MTATGRRRSIALRLAACAALLGAAVLLPATSAGATEGLRTVQMPATVRSALLTAEDSSNVAVAVVDTSTGRYWGSAAAEQEFPSESVVKVLIAAKLLATGQLTGATEQQAYLMITQSDDAAADSLWGLAGEGAVVEWAESRYGIADLGSAPSEAGWWGNTKITARGMAEFYAAVKEDPVVGTWLLDAMHHMSGTAEDGTDQTFGLAAQTTTGAFKQGWGGDDDQRNSEQLNSTGLLDDDRYAVAVLVQHVPYIPMSELLPDIDGVAAAVAPGGVVQMPSGPAAVAGSNAPASTSASSSMSVPKSPASAAPTSAASTSATPTGTLAAQPAGDRTTTGRFRTDLADGLTSGVTAVRRNAVGTAGVGAALFVVVLAVTAGRRRGRHR